MFQIHVIKNQIFPIPNQLRTVDISFNHIRLVEKHAFRGLYHLKMLNLLGNRIKEIHFIDMPIGALVDLRYNDIDDLSQLHDRPNQGSYAMYQYKTKTSYGKISVILYNK